MLVSMWGTRMTRSDIPKTEQRGTGHGALLPLIAAIS
jgi:hypothetical protein